MLIGDDIHVDVNPTLLNTSGEWVQAFWRNVSNPQKTDWIGVFLLHNTSEKIDPVHHAPTKFQVLRLYA